MELTRMKPALKFVQMMQMSTLTKSNKRSRTMATPRKMMPLASFEPPPPYFPRELEQKIFDIAARDCRTSALTSMLVARRVHIWIEPILYEEVLLDATFSLTTLDLFLRTMESKPELFFAQHVKGLFLNRVPPESALRIILACSNITNLAYINPLEPEDVDDDDISLDIAEAIEDLPLRELYTHFGIFWSIHPDSDCLQQLTHLACWDVSPEDVDRILQLVPSLTHLSLPCYFDDSRIIYQAARALAYERLQVLALVGFIFDKRFPVLARDPRVALLQLFPLLPSTDIVIPGDGNLWTIADRMVEEAYDILEAEAHAEVSPS